MQRRKFLATVGGLAAGSAAAIGTGAFSSMSATRAANVNVVNDDSGLISLIPNDSIDQVWLENGELKIDIGGDGVGDVGVNVNSRYQFGQDENPTWYGESKDGTYDSVDSAARYWDDIFGDLNPGEFPNYAEWAAEEGDMYKRVTTGEELSPRDFVTEPFFRVQNNDTTEHDITLEFDAEIAAWLGEGTDPYSFTFEDVSSGDTIDIALILLTSEELGDFGGNITVSAD